MAKRQTVVQSTMSNLVGMWALIWANEEMTAIRHTVYIYGKADERYYIVQAINSLTGEPNIAVLKDIEEMKDWTFVATVDVVNQIKDDLKNHGINRYKITI